MIELSEEKIHLYAPNASAVTNAKKICKQNGLVKRACSTDGTLLYGECSGSGKSNYLVSVDFIAPESPVSRCSCPSRQIPCKHALALLCAYLEKQEFTAGDIPEDILEKRGKLEKRREKKEPPAPSAASKKVSQSAKQKKLKKQLDGLMLVEKFVQDVLRVGIAAMSDNPVAPYKALAKELGNYDLPGPQSLVRGILWEIESCKKSPGNEAAHYQEIIETLVQLQATIQKGSRFLSEKLESGQILEEDSLLYERLGTIWQLTQLKDLGLTRTDVELAQLSFNVFADEVNAQYIDRGWWIDLRTGEISKTENMRPFKAQKYIKQDDSIFDCLQIPCLYFYPGEINRRIRWEECTTRPLSIADYEKIRSYAAPALAPLIKKVKNQIKNTLSEKSIAALIAFTRIGKIGEDYALEDAAGDTIFLRCAADSAGWLNCLGYLPDQSLCVNQILSGMFFYDALRRQIVLEPLSIVTAQQIVRLRY